MNLILIELKKLVFIVSEGLLDWFDDYTGCLKLVVLYFIYLLIYNKW